MTTLKLQPVATRGTKLYHVQFDSQSYFVEAINFGEAIAIWKEHVKLLWGKDYNGDEEPESVQCVHDEPVLRWDLMPIDPDKGPEDPASGC